MATPSAIAKRTEKRQFEILESVKGLVAEVAELKAEIGRTDVIELEAVKMMMAEIAELKAELLKTEIYGLKQQVAEISGQIAELKIILTTPPPAVTPAPPTARRTKK